MSTEPGRVCSSCGEPLIQPDVIMQGSRGQWVHESSRTIKCPESGRVQTLHDGEVDDHINHPHYGDRCMVEGNDWREPGRTPPFEMPEHLRDGLTPERIEAIKSVPPEEWEQQAKERDNESDDLTLRRYPFRWLVWLLDEALDLIPAWEEGRFYRNGGWGCRLRLHRWWMPPSWEVDARRNGE